MALAAAALRFETSFGRFNRVHRRRIWPHPGKCR
jgi:hypothetical protein